MMPSTPVVRAAFVTGFFLCASGAATASPGAAGIGALQAATPDGDVRIVATAEGYRYADGRATRALDVASGIELTSLAAVGARWYAAGVDRSGERPRLVVVDSDGIGTRVAAGPESTEAVLALPRIAAGTDGNPVLAWLEGPDMMSLAVRASVRGGAGTWTPARDVSPGDASQVALSAVGLDDGSVLLAWTRHDGDDDETVWSRLAEGTWSTPLPVAEDNDVPDITPALLARPNGRAWLAWSRYDGNDYRVVLSRFDGATWTEPEVVGGRGSLFPIFVRTGGADHLLHETAWPRTWTVFELSGEGDVDRTASAPKEILVRPLVERDEAGRISLRWPGVENASDIALAWSDGASR